MSPHGEHNDTQTAFRLGSLLPWLRQQATAEGRTMTAIVKDALAEYRQRHATPTEPPAAITRPGTPEQQREG